MTLDLLRKMIQDVVASGKKPETIILTVPDARLLNLPSWTQTLFGLKVVIASNLEKSQVTHHRYKTVQMKKPLPEEIH